MNEQSPDVVICLANLMNQSGCLNEQSEGRLALACAIAGRNSIPLITTGWDYRADTNLQVAVAMRDRAIQHYRLTPEQVMVDTSARDTVGDAVFTKRHIVGDRPWINIRVVTSDYHIGRTLTIFRFVYGPSYRISASGAQTAIGHGRLATEQSSLVSFEMTFDGVAAGDDLAILLRLYERHPFYACGALPKMTDK